MKVQTGGMDRQKKDERRKEFAKLVGSGASTAKAAAAVGISRSTGFKWAPLAGAPRRSKRKATMVQFARLVPQSATVNWMQLDVGGVVIKVDPSFDEHALARLIRVVRGAQ